MEVKQVDQQHNITPNYWGYIRLTEQIYHNFLCQNGVSDIVCFIFSLVTKYIIQSFFCQYYSGFSFKKFMKLSTAQ